MLTKIILYRVNTTLPYLSVRFYVHDYRCLRSNVKSKVVLITIFSVTELIQITQETHHGFITKNTISKALQHASKWSVTLITTKNYIKC